MAYASMILSFDKPCPIHPHERNAVGDVLPEFRYKERRTCWQEHHDGEKFLGVIALSGQLCFYLDRSTHSLMPNTSPGLFVGWQSESGLRYREMLFVADYELCRRGVWRWSSVRVVHESEVHFPTEPEFPWAIAREKVVVR